MKISAIYKIQSKIKPERIYIGSAVDIKDRWRCHLKDLRNNKHHSKKLQRHYSKYGESDLKFTVLIGCEKSELIKHEQFFIDSYNPYFNCCITAGSCMGTKRSKETIEKMRIASTGNQIWLGKKHTEESKIKIGLASKNRIPWNKGLTGIYSEETRRNISESLKGKPLTAETKLKISNSLKGRIVSIEARHKTGEAHKKPILQFDLNMNFIKEWESSNSAIEKLVLNRSGLSMCLNGRSKTTSGFIWKFKVA